MFHGLQHEMFYGYKNRRHLLTKIFYFNELYIFFTENVHGAIFGIHNIVYCEILD